MVLWSIFLLESNIDELWIFEFRTLDFIIDSGFDSTFDFLATIFSNAY